MSDPKSKELVDQYLAGKSAAATTIFDRYIQRLLALAQSRMSSKLRRRIDPEDIVQSAYRSFFVHAQNQEYVFTHSGDLWRLLAGTTLNKLFGQIEKHLAAKRSIDQEKYVEDQWTGLETREPSIVEIVAIGEQLSLIMAELSQDERQVLEATLQGRSIEQIATEIGKSTRTVRRLYDSAKKQFENHLLGKTNRPKVKPSRHEEPSAPLQFSNYLLTQLIGAGGMGKVYRATDKQSGKTVAIKALHKIRQSDERAVTQFVQESKILSGLKHPSIVSTQGLGRFPGGGYFIVMEYIEGANIQTRLESGPMPLSQAIPIIKQVTAAIQFAHDHGIIHCDLKPANVLLDSNGKAVVTDFGFAYILDKSPNRPSSTIGGTRGFIAPEVLTLRSKPTPPSDIYAIGALLWTLLTGKPPQPTASTAKDTNLPASMISVCRKCLSTDPKDRFQSAKELLDALHQLKISDA